MSDTTTTEPNCYECIHRRNLPGEMHSCCAHPKVGKEENMFAMLVGTIRGQKLQAAIDLGITGHSHGIRSGWFMWPANFDPVWLKSCNGFEKAPKS